MTVGKIISITAIPFFLFLTTIGCKQKRPEPNFYKNLYTGEILTKPKFEEFRNNLYLENKVSGKRFKMNFVFYELEKSSDSIIQNFKYDLRIGNKYLVNSSNAKIFDLINNKFPIKTFKSIHGESIQLGGIRDKPTLINFWYTHCPPCIAEMPALNKIKEK